MKKLVPCSLVLFAGCYNASVPVQPAADKPNTTTVIIKKDEHTCPPPVIVRPPAPCPPPRHHHHHHHHPGINIGIGIH